MSHYTPESNPFNYPYEHAPTPENWEDGEQPVHIVSFATYGANGPEAAGNMNPIHGQPGMSEINQTPNELNGLLTQADALAEADPEKALELQRQHADVIAMRDVEGKKRLSRFLEVQGIPEAAVFIVKPQSDWANPEARLVPTNVDDEPGVQLTYGGVRKGEYISDMIYTHNPEQALAITPADCPTLIGRGKDSEGEDVMWLSHAGWQGQEKGYVEQGLDFMINELGVDMTTVKFQIAAGGIEFGYTMDEASMRERLANPIWDDNIQNITEREDGKYDFEIDMFGALITTLEQRGVDLATQVNVDNTDTSRLDSGHSSHQRFASPNIAPERKQKAPMRDMVIAMSPQMARECNARGTELLKKELAESKQ